MRTVVAIVIALSACKGEPAPTPKLPSGPAAASPECVDGTYPPRQLRLLTRREYDATVRDLLPLRAASGDTCATDPDCAWQSESCVGGVCQPDPCATHTFHFAEGPYGTVHVAGDFNGWAPTIAEGGWPMRWEPALGAYLLKRELPDGDHAYKLVIDERDWRADPSNPDVVDDGYGGQNSALSVDCAGVADPGPPSADYTAGFLPESRPEHYLFDNAAQSGLVTAVHVERYLDAAEAIAADVDRGSLLDCADRDEPCLRAWVTAFGARAFRRPLTAAEVDRYTGLAMLDDGVSLAVRAFLSSPGFLYRQEVGEPSEEGYFLTDHEIASSLSYLLWGTMPDPALQARADAGQLTDPAVVEAEARRLLADPRARAMVSEFTEQWLGLGGVLTDPKNDPAVTPSLRASMLEETRRFVQHVTFDGDQRFTELLTAEVTFADAELAALYGVTPSGDGPVALDGRRAGLLGHASVLASTSHSDQTSPVRRGLLVRERLLCTTLGAPPPNAGGVPEVDPASSTLERFRQHSDDPACSGCHQHIDPIGFGLENFDPIGRWRDVDGAFDIPGEGVVTELEGLGSGVDAPFHSQPELGRLLAESGLARRCFATQWYRFTIGGFEGGADCSVDVAEDWFLQADTAIQELLVGLTQAPGFYRRAP